MSVILSATAPTNARLDRTGSPLYSGTKYTDRLIVRPQLTALYQVLKTWGNPAGAGGFGSNSWEIGINASNCLYFANNASGGERNTYAIGGAPTTLTNGQWIEIFFVIEPLPVGACVYFAPAEQQPSAAPLRQITPYTSPDIFTGATNKITYGQSPFDPASGGIFQPQGPMLGGITWDNVALSMAQCEAERLSIPPSSLTGLWAWWAMQDAATAGVDGNGNVRPLTAGGIITTGGDPILGGAVPWRTRTQQRLR